MEIKRYYVFVKRNWVMLVIFPVLAVVASYFLVKTIPNNYVSKTQIITGIVDQTQQVIESQNDNGRESKNNEQFMSIMETLQLDKTIDQVSYSLLIHDLTAKVPFRNTQNLYENLSEAAKKSVVDSLKVKLENYELLNVNIPRERLIDSLLKEMKYDPENLLKKNLTIYHADGSDLINLECESENADLSAFMLNTLSDRFINYYTENVNKGHNKSAVFLKGLLDKKREAMDKKMAALQEFKVRNGILDMVDESKGIYDQIGDIQSHEQQAEKDIIAYSGALKSIDERFDPAQRQYFEAASAKINSSIVSTRERFRAMNDIYIQSNFDKKYKKSIDSLQNVLSNQINESSDKYISNPLAAKENIVQEKLKMENDLQLAKYSQTSLSAQLTKLKSRINGLVPAQAALSSFERDIDVNTKEYLDIQSKYNQASLSTIIPVELRQLQQAVPGTLVASKKILLVALSGVTALILCLVILLVVFYFDNSIKTGDDLELKTQIPVIGQLNYLANIKPGRRIRSKDKEGIPIFRDLLRSIRFEIDNELKDNKVLAITSLNSSEGKTLFSFSLAYAYAMVNKKVLLIDGNFTNPAISKTVQSTEFLEDYFTEAMVSPTIDNQLQKGNEMSLLAIGHDTSIGDTIQQLNSQANLSYDHQAEITILGNKGSDISLLEISNELNIHQKMDQLKSKFDIIIIESGSLDTFNKSKEWILFADKTVAVFENNRSLKGSHKKQLKYLRGLKDNLVGWVLNKVSINQEDLELV